MYQDKTLICVDCGREFVWTAGEQEFYAEQGFNNEPKRCRECREARKKGAKAPREMYVAICANCGKSCKVHLNLRRAVPYIAASILQK